MLKAFSHWPEIQKQAVLRLVGEFKPYRGKTAGILLLGLLISALQPLAVKITQAIIDDLQKGVPSDFYRRGPFWVVMVMLVSGFAKYSHNTLKRYVGEKVVMKLRAALFEKYLHMPLSRLDRRKSGEMLSSIQNDLAQVASGIDSLWDILKEPFTFLALIIFAFTKDWILTSCTLLMAPVIAFLFSRSGVAVKRYAGRSLSQFAELMSLNQESIAGSRVVKVFRLEPLLSRKFNEVHSGYFNTTWKSIKVQELSSPTVEFVGTVLMAGVFIYGGYRVSHGYLTTGDLIAFILAIVLAQMPIKSLNNAWLKIRAAEAAAERIFHTLDQPISQPCGTRSVLPFTKEIAFESVSLIYDDKPALNDISLKVQCGECVAFVGTSGSGKTSIVNLLPRLYDPTGGRITIDGVDIREVPLEVLRGLISFVTQDTFLFNDSIYENIRYGKPSASAEEITRAAEMAHCTDFIARCREGFQTRIGDRGMRLSGGERQRIAIARAILKAAPILVLDEATSSLDSHSEVIVQEALEELMFEKTTFLVAHRFSSVLRANRIFVIEHGKIHEAGSHQELVEQGGIYTGLFERQRLPEVTNPS